MRAFSMLSWLLLVSLGTASVSAQVIFEENFDSYAVGSTIAGQGGWDTWDSAAGVDAIVSDVQSLSPTNSLFVENNQDIVQQFAGLDSGRYRVTASVWVDEAQVGDAYFIMLNNYDGTGVGYNWSVQLRMNAGNAPAGEFEVADLGGSAGVPGGATLTYPTDQWNSIQVDIDLDNNLHNIYFNGDATKECEVWSPGTIELQCMDLYAAGQPTNGVYFDDITVEELTGGACETPSGLACTSVNCDPGPGDMELTWTNPSTYDNIEIYRDGTLIATILGTDTSYTDPALAPGGYSYGVVGLCGVDSSCPAACGPVSHCPPPYLVYSGGAFDTTRESAAMDLVGLTYDFTTDATSGASLLVGGYDLVVWSQPNFLMDDSQAQAVIDHVNGGGKAVFAYWDLDGSSSTFGLLGDLQTTFGVTAVTGMTGAPTFYPEAGSAGHPIWDGPYGTFASMDQLALGYGNTGNNMSPDTGTMIGTFDPAGIDATQAAIVVNGTTVINGWTHEAPDFADAVSILANQVEFLDGPGPGGPQFVRGDANADGGFDISDAVFTLSFLFVLGSPPPECEDSSDSNDDGGLDISDAVFSLSALFVGGSPAPSDPNPDCGDDPTPDALGCASFTPCP